MLSLARVRRSVVVVAAGALVVASVGSSVPVLALSDGSQSTEIAVEQAEIDTGNSFGVEGPVVAGVSGNFASVLAPQTASVFDRSNTLGAGVTPQIAAGGFHTCALLNTGAVNCWGYNSFGGLGNNTNIPSSEPVAVSAFTDVSATAVSIAAGYSHTCALLNTGAVNCWGSNSDGQLGNGSTTDSLVPVAVDPFTDGATAVSITAGDYHTCAVLNTGAVNCWGYNVFGGLGNNTNISSSVPVAVSAFTDVTGTAVSITAGD
uniref:RCC1 domain-containing protein n=1 Tax=uncultured Ilumatobacter sp. TaxID=879968 RepID=UPI00374EB421